MTHQNMSVDAGLVAVHGYWIHPHAPHGTVNGYRNFKCRCRACGTAWAHRVREERAQRKAKYTIVNGRRHVHAAPHGTPSGYTNHGCRCDACRAAIAASRREKSNA